MREIDHGSPAARGLLHQEKTTVKTRTRISGDFIGSFGKHPLDLLPQGLSPRRACPVRRKRYRSARKGRRRVQEGNTVTVPENGHDPGLGSYRLPLPPERSQATPNSQRESRPVRLTSFRLLYLFPQSGRSLRRKRKREPYPCGSSSSCQPGQNGKKTTSASEQDEHQRSSSALNQTLMTHRPSSSCRFLRNPGRKKGTLNKSVVGSRPHLGQR